MNGEIPTQNPDMQSRPEGLSPQKKVIEEANKIIGLLEAQPEAAQKINSIHEAALEAQARGEGTGEEELEGFRKKAGEILNKTEATRATKQSFGRTVLAGEASDVFLKAVVPETPPENTQPIEDPNRYRFGPKGNG